MGTSKKNAEQAPAEAPTVVTLDLADAKQLYELYENLVLADTHFLSCQSPQFRQYIQGVYKAKNVSGAYDKLKAQLGA